MLQIKPASAADVDPILELIQPFVEAELLLPRNWEEILRLTQRGFVAVSEDRVVGFASVEMYSTKLAEIHCLAVDQEFQNEGVGKLLVAECIKLSQSEGILELMAITASERFLKSCGFDYSLPNQKRALFYRFDQHD